MSTVSLAIGGTETAGGGRLVDRGLWLVSRRHDLACVVRSRFFAFCRVILSFLLIHYYFDHFIFLQRDRVNTPRFEAS
jgi:hypothetical protein